MSTSTRRTRIGFTLIELLVVIAIIAILAAILFPAVPEGARERPKDRLPVHFEANRAGRHPVYTGILGQGWGSTVYPYVKSMEVFHCPDDPTTGATSETVTSYPVSYSGNLNFLRRDIPGPANDPRTGQSLASPVSPAKTVMLCESSGIYAPITDPIEANGPTGRALSSPVTNGNALGGVYPFKSNGQGRRLETGCLGGKDCSSKVASSSNGNQGFAALTGRHTDGSNYMMTDCHAKWYRGSSVSGGMTAMAEDCNQDGTPSVADCNGGAGNPGMVEGTGGGKYAVTFSTR